MEVILKFYTVHEIQLMFRRLEAYGLYSTDNKNNDAIPVSTIENDSIPD